MIVENAWRILQISRVMSAPGAEQAMDGRHDQQQERQAVMHQAYREELVERIGRAVREEGGYRWRSQSIPPILLVS